jgi:hypothetical protein
VVDLGSVDGGDVENLKAAVAATVAEMALLGTW